MPDHVHMCIEIPPKYSVASIIGSQPRRQPDSGTPSHQRKQAAGRAKHRGIAGELSRRRRHTRHGAEKIRFLKDELNMGHLVFYGQESRMSHEATMRSIELFGKEVMPAIREW